MAKTLPTAVRHIFRKLNPEEMGSLLSSRQGAATLSVISNLILITSKVIVGFLSGSISVISEALQSSTGLLAALIALFSIRAAQKPADANHPYGHAKAESLAAIGQALLILIAVLLIVNTAVERLLYGAVIVHLDWAVGVMVISTVVNFLVSRHVFNVARQTDSRALAANAWSLATDLYTDVGVAVGLILAWFTGLTALDPLIALGLALVILKAAWDVTRASVGDLLDESLSPRDETRIRDIIAAHAGLYSRLSRIRTRRGPSPYVEVALEFPAPVSLPDAHALTEHLEDEMRRAFPRAVVVVEAEPAPPPTPPTPRHEKIVDDIRQVANRLGASVHQISAHAIQENLEVNLHLEVDSALSLRQAHELATRVEDEIKREFPAIVSVNTHIEPVEANSEIAADELREREWILIELAKITRDLPQVRNVHEVDVHRHDRQLFISLHCILDGALPIGQAHWISGEIEARLKRAHPAIANVTVHTEPDSETTT